MKTKFIVNLPGCLVAEFTAIIFAWMTALAFQCHKVFLALIFVTLSLLYVCIALRNGTVVQISKDGVTLQILGRCIRRLPWENVEEVGVLGTRIFASQKSKKHGLLYMYYSERKLTQEERFELCLKWPPKKIIYHCFSKDIKVCMEKFWQKEIASYNAPEDIWISI